MVALTADTPVGSNLGISIEGSGAEADQLLPLREDISLHPGGRLRDGAPTWVLYDPALNTFYNIGWLEFEILSRWSLGSSETIANAVNRATPLAITVDDVAAVANFLTNNGLMRQESSAVLERREFLKNSRGFRLGGLLAEHVLFRRFPIFRPQRFLENTVRFVEPFFSRRFFQFICLLLMVSIYLVGRDWSAFVAGFSEIYSLEGALSIAVALIIAKCCHELAHAYAAVRLGCRVPVMGVALLVFWPVLFTETSDAWRLTDRRQRIQIAAAGITAEFYIAVIALFAWSFIDDGALRNGVLFSATTLLVISIVFNANPLMRFDGYFVLSEALGIDNMQSRAISLLQWFLRKHIAGCIHPCPERGFTANRRNTLLSYGLALVLYRVVLYGGISYAIYQLAFPAVAVPVIAVLILQFLVLPAISEIGIWFRSAYASFGIMGALRVGLAAAIFMAPFLIPWRTTVVVPVVYHGGEAHDIFPPEDSIFSSLLVKSGQSVKSGTPIARLSAPYIDHQIKTKILKARRIERILNQHITAAIFQNEHSVRETELGKLVIEIEGLVERRNKLTLRAPSDGLVTYIQRGLGSGVWVNTDARILQLVDNRVRRAVGYLDERDIGLIGRGAAGVVWFDGVPNFSTPVEVSVIHQEAVKSLDEPILATLHDGPIATRPSREDGLVPESGVYKVILQLSQPDTVAGLPLVKTRGFAKLETAPRNLIGRIGEKILGLWRREFG